MVAAVAFGIGLGLVVGYFRAARRFAFAPVHLLGLFPSLGLVPLFAFWFGPTTEGVIALVGWGAGILMLRVTLNAVENVPLVYIQAGQTLGASGLHLYRTVIIPATLPELRGGLLIAVTYAWTFVLGAELIGVQSGLGRLMFLAYRFTQIGRMVVIGVTFIFLATVSVMLFHRGADWLTRWAK
jgi:sulfonate transport system permease protein